MKDTSTRTQEQPTHDVVERVADGTYITIPERLIFARCLSILARLSWIMLQEWAALDPFRALDIAALSDDLNVSQSKIQSAIRELVDHKWLKVEGGVYEILTP
jgi:transcriptional antiterminator